MVRGLFGSEHQVGRACRQDRRVPCAPRFARYAGAGWSATQSAVALWISDGFPSGLRRVAADLVVLEGLAIRPRQPLAAEKGVLRRQPALFEAKGLKRARIHVATRAELTVRSTACRIRRDEGIFRS